MGINAIFMFTLIITVMILSMKKVSDTLLIIVGNVFWIVGGTAMYLLWTADAKIWHYVVPFFIGVAGFPFITPSNRSLFTLAVASIPELEGAQASMQAVLSMAASVAGIVTPSLVAVFVLRDPEDVDNGSDNHELTLGALYVPIGSGICISLVLYQQWLDGKKHLAEFAVGDGEVPSEKTKLVSRSARASNRRSSVIEIKQAFSRQNESARRHSVEVIHVSVPFENSDELEYRDRLWEDKKEFDHLNTIMDEEEK
jgi:hypothetical protein